MKIYHYCKKEIKDKILKSKKLRLIRYTLNEKADELSEGLRLIREFLPESQEWDLRNHLEEIISTYAYYLACFTDRNYSKDHEKYGESFLCFDKDRLDCIAFDFMNAQLDDETDSCFFECTYKLPRNLELIKKEIKLIKESKSPLETAGIKIKFLEKVLPKIKNEKSKDDKEFRIFISKDDVQNDPIYPKKHSSPRIQNLPRVMKGENNEYFVELPYGNALISSYDSRADE